MKYRGFVIRSENGRHIARSATDDISFTSRGVDRLHLAIDQFKNATAFVGLKTLRRIDPDIISMAEWLRDAIANGKTTINLDHVSET